MIYSGASPAYITPKCYDDIDIALEYFYNSEANPFRNYFEDGVRVTQEYVVNRFNLVIEDYDEDMLLITLRSKENHDYVPFKQVFHKEYGEVE